MWQNLIINPLTNTLHFIHSHVGDLGFSIILLTVIIRVVLLPINFSAHKTGKNIRKIHPQIEEIKKKHKENPRDLALEMQKLYKENQIKPFSSIFGLLIQIPILIGLYQIINNEISQFDKSIAFGFLDITKSSFLIAFLVFVAMYILMKMSVRDMKEGLHAESSQLQKDFHRIMSLQMEYFLPILTLIFTLFLPAGIGLYLLTANIFAIGQTHTFKKITNKAIK